MSVRLSQHFTLEELCKSQQAERHQLDNRPSDPEIELNLRELCEKVLEPVRAHFGKPFSPSSGYRSPEVNRIVKGSKNSQHMRGEAADFELPGIANHDLATWIEGNLTFDQLILEFYSPGELNSGWVHCSFSRSRNRGETLTINKDGRFPGLRR